MTGARGDRGSAAIWLLACCALLVVIAGAAVVRATAVLSRHRAEAAADVTALAAAGRLGTGQPPCAAAAPVAVRNGAELVACRVHLDATSRGGTVDVVVRLAVQLPVVGAQAVLASARAGRSARLEASPSKVRFAGSRIPHPPGYGMLHRGFLPSKAAPSTPGRRRTER